MAVHELNLKLHPKQLMALQTRATECLMGGGVLSGKSYLVRVAAIIHCLEIPFCQAYLFRRRHRELISTHMEGPGSLPVLLAGLSAEGCSGSIYLRLGTTWTWQRRINKPTRRS
jgi:hypothetical protein